MDIIGRVKHLRKEVLNLTQQEFADKINLKRTTIGNLEAGNINLTDRNIKLICETFGISEKWLRTGKEPMLTPKTRDQKMGDQFGKLYGASSFRKDMVEFFLDLSDEECDQVEKFAYKLIDFLAAKKDNNN